MSPGAGAMTPPGQDPQAADDEKRSGRPGQNTRPAARTGSGEPLWTLVKRGVRCTFELRDHGEEGCDLQVLIDGEFRFAHRHQRRVDATGHAEIWRIKLELAGWQE
jgi:hypothetical protein